MNVNSCLLGTDSGVMGTSDIGGTPMAPDEECSDSLVDVMMADMRDGVKLGMVVERMEVLRRDPSLLHPRIDNGTVVGLQPCDSDDRPYSFEVVVEGVVVVMIEEVEVEVESIGFLRIGIVGEVSRSTSLSLFFLFSFAFSFSVFFLSAILSF